jgi:hypothetical protein
VRRRIVAQVDEDLRRAAIRHGEGIRDGAALVRFAPQVVGNRARAPDVRDFRIAVDSELDPFVFDDAVESHLVVIACAHKVVKTIYALRRPGAMDFDDDDAFAGFQTHVEKLRRPDVHFGIIGIEQPRRRLAVNRQK